MHHFDTPSFLYIYTILLYIETDMLLIYSINNRKLFYKHVPDSFNKLPTNLPPITVGAINYRKNNK